MYYDALLDDGQNATPREPAQEWIEALERADADIAVGLTVPLEDVLNDLRTSLARMEAREAKASAKA